MSATGLPVFDETLHATNTWLHEITARMGWEDRHKSYRLLRVSLHSLRDRLPVASAAKLAAQLPMLARGMFYEGWRPSDVPKKIRSRDEFLADVRAAFSEDPAFDAEAAFREVVAVMRMHISEGEMEILRNAMPSQIRTLWEDGERP
jgi:uncharacterized protein (DUF2267 family)